MREASIENLEAIDKRIDYYLQKAEELGEEGKIEESEALVKEIDRMKVQKQELTTQMEDPLSNREKQMQVCQICGAMQSITDTDKRLNTHLEGKIHIGFLKVRKLLKDLKQEKDEYKHAGRRMRTPSPDMNRARESETRDRRDKKKRVDGGWRGYFSSKVKGTGINMPESQLTQHRYADAALEANRM